MVAISLYKGNLHRVPDVPRKWIMPTRKISLKDFKTLLRRRSRALSLLSSSAFAGVVDNPYPITNSIAENDDNSDDRNCDADPEIPHLKVEPEVQEEIDDRVEEEDGGGDCLEKVGVEVDDSVAVEVNNEVNDTGVNLESELKDEVEIPEVKMEEEEKEVEDLVNPGGTETGNKEDTLSDKGKRKREFEEKLHILKEKKHGLVQVLKQILNAEEELKRRSCMQGVAVRSSVPLHVDIPNDTGSMTRLNTPRIGSDGILTGETEGGETDGMSNLNAETRQLLRLSSASPSSDSQHKKPSYNVIPHPARTSLGVTGSPSCFAPTGQQGQPSNLPTLSVSGTNYIASSPSPAASGGTSAFRDSRIPSPWN